ncbi:MAG: NUDIX hydrolase [Patescibacteria group bacterium]
MTKTHYVGKCVVVNADGDVLILLRGETAPRRPLEWDLPGGMVDQTKESYTDGTLRELTEETGLIMHPSDTKLVHASTHMYEHADYGSNNVVFIFYVIHVDNPEIKISWEHDEYKWCKPEELHDAITYDTHQIPLDYIVEHNLL